MGHFFDTLNPDMGLLLDTGHWLVSTALATGAELA
jgi:hypothetical protein